MADPWRVTVSGDFAYDGTTGRKAPGTDLLNRYMARLAVAAQHDEVVALRLKEVAVLERRPQALMSPALAVRALRAASRGPGGGGSTTDHARRHDAAC